MSYKNSFPRWLQIHTIPSEHGTYYYKREEFNFNEMYLIYINDTI